VTLGSQTSALLSEHRQRQAGELGSPVLDLDDSPVFTTEDGTRVNPNSVGRIVVGDDKIMQERLGHADIGVTLNTYTHTVIEQHRLAGERIDGIFQ